MASRSFIILLCDRQGEDTGVGRRTAAHDSTAERRDWVKPVAQVRRTVLCNRGVQHVVRSCDRHQPCLTLAHQH